MTASLLALWAGLATPAPARQAPASDSAQHAHLRSVMQATFDAFDRLRGATHEFRLDLDDASAELVLARAARLQRECRAADSALAGVEQVLASPPPTPAARRQVPPTRAAARTLRGAFARCIRDWQLDARRPAHPDSIRAWAPYRTSQLDQVLHREAPQFQAFAHAAGVEPRR
ncbi:MAG TPA: hypothetical protein VI160_08580 [Gemmatimonadales bacterium]